MGWRYRGRSCSRLWAGPNIWENLYKSIYKDSRWGSILVSANINKEGKFVNQIHKGRAALSMYLCVYTSSQQNCISLFMSSIESIVSTRPPLLNAMVIWRFLAVLLSLLTRTEICTIKSHEIAITELSLERALITESNDWIWLYEHGARLSLKQGWNAACVNLDNSPQHDCKVILEREIKSLAMWWLGAYTVKKFGEPAPLSALPGDYMRGLAHLSYNCVAE